LNGAPPTTEQGLGALVSMPTSQPVPRRWRRLMTDIPLDPWGQLYYYEFPARRGTKESFDLYSAGPDRKPGTPDDIGNW